MVERIDVLHLLVHELIEEWISWLSSLAPLGVEACLVINGIQIVVR